jgi:hypothetical protein
MGWLAVNRDFSSIHLEQGEKIEVTLKVKNNRKAEIRDGEGVVIVV